MPIVNSFHFPAKGDTYLKVFLYRPSWANLLVVPLIVLVFVNVSLPTPFVSYRFYQPGNGSTPPDRVNTYLLSFIYHTNLKIMLDLRIKHFML